MSDFHQLGPVTPSRGTFAARYRSSRLVSLANLNRGRTLDNEWRPVGVRNSRRPRLSVGSPSRRTVPRSTRRSTMPNRRGMRHQTNRQLVEGKS